MCLLSSCNLWQILPVACLHIVTPPAIPWTTRHPGFWEAVRQHHCFWVAFMAFSPLSIFYSTHLAYCQILRNDVRSRDKYVVRYYQERDVLVEIISIEISDNIARWKSRWGKSLRREKKKNKNQRRAKSHKKEDAGAQKVRKVAVPFFPMFWGSGGSKSRLDNYTTPHYIQQLRVRWSLQPFQKTQLQPPFGPSVDSLCHPCIITTHLFWKLPSPPCAVLLVSTGNVFIHARIW